MGYLIGYYLDMPEKWKKLVATDDFVQRYRRYFRNEWFRNQSAFWNNEKVIRFSENINIHLCYTFNMAKFNEVYREEV
jgi:hypothetical protein